MAKRVSIAVVAAAIFAVASVAIYLSNLVWAASGEVKELAPGVYFREQNGGCNNGWVVFDDYVLVIDANFPMYAEKVMADIKKTTSKPVRFVFDTHYHGDHAFGNAIYTQTGAVAVAHENCLLELIEKGASAFETAAKTREDLARTKLKNPSVIFHDKLVFDDGARRVELLYNGHAHTRGDAIAYLPKEKIAFVGDACLNAPFNPYTGDGDTENWIKVLDAIAELDIKTVAPGHGPLGGKDILAKEREYFVELRKQVAEGVAAGKPVEEVMKSVTIPTFEAWTGKKVSISCKENIQHVYAEVAGLITPPSLLRLGLTEGDSPTKSASGWSKPKKIVLPASYRDRLANLAMVAPGVEFKTVSGMPEAAKEAADADAVVGLISADVIRAGKHLRWLHSISAGVESYVTMPELVNGDIVLTNGQRLYGPEIADHVFGMVLSFTRGLRVLLPIQIQQGKWAPRNGNYGLDELRGQTLLVVGLGGIGTEVARRAAGFEMRVLAVDPKVSDRPTFVHHLGKPAELKDLLPRADVIVSACPLTSETRGMFGSAEFAQMKRSAYFINIARGGLVQTDALVSALRDKQIAGAGLDVADPEPLPSDSPLWKLSNVIITPHIAGISPPNQDRLWLLLRENVRRFAAGEKLLSVVDKKAGY